MPASAESVVLEGTDATGVFAATVARGDADGRTVQRRIHNYRRLWDVQATSVVVDKAFLTVRRDAGVWFASMSGEGSLRGGGMTSARTTLRASSHEPDPALFAQASREEASYVWEDLLPGAASPLLSSSMTAAQVADREKFKHVTPDAALDQFLRDCQSNGNIDAQWRGLAAYFEARPETIPRFRRTLAENLLPPAARAPAFLALGRARVPEAREALVAINRDRSTTVLNRSQAAILLAVRSDVDISLARSLRADAMRLPDRAAAPPAERAYARSAVLALGIMGNVQRDRVPDAATEAKATIADLLPLARTATELSPVFGAIGNLGDVSFLPEAERWSRHADAEIRMNAAVMIRRIPLERSESVVLDWLAREASPGVKRAIYATLRGVLDDHPADLSPALALQAARDLRAQPDIITRQALVRILGPQAAKSPEAKAALLAQVPLEAGRADGLYTLLSQYLPGDEVSAALDAMPARGDR